MIIGISGRMNSGKDEVGKIIQYLTACDKLDRGFSSMEYKGLTKNNWDSIYGIQNWEIKKYADKLKDITCLLLGCTREQLEDRDYKESELGEEWWYWKVYSDILKDKFELISYKIGETGFYDRRPNYKGHSLVKLTPRKLMQQLGTECGRQILHPSIWCNALMSEYNMRSGHFNDVANGRDTDDGFPNWLVTDVRFPNELQAIKDRKGISIRVVRTPKWEKDLRLKLQDELPNKTYDISAGDFKVLTGKGGKIDFEVALKRELYNLSTHESETALDDAEFDYYIDNSGTIEDLIMNVKLILIKEKLLNLD